MYTREIEIRKVQSVHLGELAQILELNDSWRKLMCIIPKNPFSDSPEDLKFYKYNTDDERLIENASRNQNRTPAQILFDEWGTSGRKRPTLGLLLELLVRAQLFRAADFVAMKLLNEPPPERPSQGPAAKIDISIPFDSEIIKDIESMLDDGECPGTETLNDNAKPSRLADNNIDYFEKYTRNDKRLSIPNQSNGIPSTNSSQTANNSEAVRSLHSDLMKFSSASIGEYRDSQEVIPMLSDLLHSSSTQSSNSNNSSHTIVSEQNSSVDLPMLSAFNAETSPTTEVIPNLSALNVYDSTNGVKSKMSIPVGLDDLSPSTLSSTSPSAVSSSLDDDDDLSAPNLSILDQRSSNNDSSLTNVTATSEDNSFEISLNNESSTSYDNIPCLSALK